VYFSFFPTEIGPHFCLFPFIFKVDCVFRPAALDLLFAVSEELLLTPSDTSQHPPRARGNEGASSCRAPHGHIVDISMTFDMTMSKEKKKRTKKSNAVYFFFLPTW